jgi:hypothetical protein
MRHLVRRHHAAAQQVRLAAQAVAPVDRQPLALEQQLRLLGLRTIRQAEPADRLLQLFLIENGRRRRLRLVHLLLGHGPLLVWGSLAQRPLEQAPYRAQTAGRARPPRRRYANCVTANDANCVAPARPARGARPRRWSVPCDRPRPEVTMSKNNRDPSPFGTSLDADDLKSVLGASAGARAVVLEQQLRDAAPSASSSGGGRGLPTHALAPLGAEREPAARPARPAATHHFYRPQPALPMLRAAGPRAAEAPAPSPTPARSGSIVAELERLADLRERGLIDEAELTFLKRRLLAGSR